MEWIDIIQRTPPELGNDVLLYDRQAGAIVLGFLYAFPTGRYWHVYAHPDSPLCLDEGRISHWLPLPRWPPEGGAPPEYVSVEDRLPEPGEKVLLFNPWLTGHHSLGHLLPGGQNWWWERGSRPVPLESGSQDRVSHWLPLPAAPR